jgi:hypothetical protein
VVGGTMRGSLRPAAAAHDRMYAAMPSSALHAPLPRRQVLGVLAAAALAGLAGCRRSTGAAPAPTPTPTGPDPLLADLADEQRLLSAYDETLRAHPALAGRLRPLRANHAEHVTALTAAIGAVPSPSVTPSAVPKAPAAALAGLRALEHAAVAARTAAAVRATGGRAALLASLAACSACHEVVLA